MAAPREQIEISLPRTYPEAVPLHVMNRLLNAVQRIVGGDKFTQMVGDDGEPPVEAPAGPLRLLKTKRQSATYVCYVENPQVALANAETVGMAIETAFDRSAASDGGPSIDQA